MTRNARDPSRGLGAVFGWLGLGRRRRDAVGQLDDRLLRDIGLTRSEARALFR